MRISSISRGENNNNKKNRYSLHTHMIFFSLFLIAIFKSYDTTSNPYSVRHNMWLCVCLFLGPQTRTHNNIIPTLNGVEKNKYWNDKRTWCAPHLSMSTFKSFSHQMMVPRGPCTSNYINYTYRLGYPLSYKYILNIYIRHTRTWIKAQKKKSLVAQDIAVNDFQKGCVNTHAYCTGRKPHRGVYPAAAMNWIVLIVSSSPHCALFGNLIKQLITQGGRDIRFPGPSISRF